MNKMGFYLLNTVTLLMLVVFSFSMISASASESGENTVSKIKEIISEVYWQKDMNSQSNGLTEDTMDMLSTDIANFLIKKIDTQQYVTQLYGTDKENYSISVKLKSSNIVAEKNKLILDFVVITCFNYAGCNFDTEISEIVTVVYDCAAGQIVDMYTPLNYYDMRFMEIVL